MKNILIRDFLDSDVAVSYSNGEKLYNFLQVEFDKADKINLDFSSIKAYATPFFNASIGYLLKDKTINELKEKLDFQNLSENGFFILNRVIKNSIEYYNNKEKIDRALIDED